MKTFKQFIIEAKQVGKLYHITSMDNIQSILRNDELKTFTKIISLTRNKHYKAVSGKWEKTGIIFTLDGDKLSDKYKLVPHKDSKSGFGGRFEAEEQVTGPIKPLSKYLLNIDINEANNLDPNIIHSIRNYMADNPHITMTADREIPSSISNSTSLKTIHGYWWKDKVYTMKELVDLHPYFEDWEDIDKGYMISVGGRPDETIPPKVIFVNVYNVDHRTDMDWPAPKNNLEDLRIDVWYNSEDKTLGQSIAKKVKKQFPSYNVKLKEVIDQKQYADDEYDDYDPPN